MTRIRNIRTGEYHMTDGNAYRHYLSKAKKAVKTGKVLEFFSSFDILDMDDYCPYCDMNDIGYCGLRRSEISQEDKRIKWCIYAVIKKLEHELGLDKRGVNMSRKVIHEREEIVLIESALVFSDYFSSVGFSKGSRVMIRDVSERYGSTAVGVSVTDEEKDILYTGIFYKDDFGVYVFRRGGTDSDDIQVDNKRISNFIYLLIHNLVKIYSNYPLRSLEFKVGVIEEKVKASEKGKFIEKIVEVVEKESNRFSGEYCISIV